MAEFNSFANTIKTYIKQILNPSAAAIVPTAQNAQPLQGERAHAQAQASQPQSATNNDSNLLEVLGTAARTNVRKHTIPDLENAIRKFGVESYVNNVDKVKEHLTNIGIDISNAKEERLTEIGILLYQEGAFQPGGVLEGLLEVTENTTIHHVRGVNPPPVNVQRVLEDYLAGRVGILVVSYNHVKCGEDRYGMSQENFAELMSMVRHSREKQFLWVDKVRSRGRGLRWSPDCSLMYIAFPGYQMMNIRSCNRLWITTERDSMWARKSSKKGETPALRAYAVICRNAIRGDYDNCPVYEWDDSAPFIAWAKRLMSKLFTGKLQWGELDGTECFQHAAVAVVYNFTTLNVFLGSKELRAIRDETFGLLSALQFSHKFWPEQPRKRDIEDVDVAIENAMDWYIRADNTFFHFLGRLRHGPQGTTCYRGTLLDPDVRQDFMYGVLRTGEVLNSDSVHPGVLSIAFQHVWEGEDEETYIKVLGLDDLLKRMMFESVMTGETDTRVVARQVLWSEKNAVVVRGTHMYLYKVRPHDMLGLLSGKEGR